MLECIMCAMMTSPLEVVALRIVEIILNAITHFDLLRCDLLQDEDTM